MKTRATFVWLAAMMVAVLVLPAAGAARPVAAAGTTWSDQVHAYFNFEQSISPWEAMSDSPMHTYKISQQSGDNGCPDMLGNHFARLVTVSKTTQDSLKALQLVPPTKYGTWTIASFEVAGDGLRQVTVQWSAKWSIKPGNGVQTPNGKYDGIVAFAGINPPAKSLEFTRPPKSDIAYGWQTYKYVTYVNMLPGDAGITTPVFVALGWDNVGASLDLDCVDVSITYPNSN